MQPRVTEIVTTPNPHTLRFVTDLPLTQNSLNFFSADDAKNNTIGKEIFSLPGIECVFLAPTCVSVTKNSAYAWNHIIEDIRSAIESSTLTVAVDPLDPEEFLAWGPRDQMSAILAVIDHDIRPGLIMDGGNLDVLEFSSLTLKIRYEGACKNCPAATAATLPFIEKTLQQKIHPQLKVVLA